MMTNVTIAGIPGGRCTPAVLALAAHLILPATFGAGRAMSVSPLAAQTVVESDAPRDPRPHPGRRAAAADRYARWSDGIHLRQRHRRDSPGGRERGHSGRAELQRPQVRRRWAACMDERTKRRGTWRVRRTPAAAGLPGSDDHGVRLAPGPDHRTRFGRERHEHACAQRGPVSMRTRNPSPDWVRLGERGEFDVPTVALHRLVEESVG